MPESTELANVPVGASIEAFKKKFTVLEQAEEGVLALSETVETRMLFREKCKAAVAENDFRDSDIHRYLSGEYLNNLVKNGADANEDFAVLKVDLKCTLGQREYGFFDTKVGLLTLEQYGKYFDIIPEVGCAWWLATPYGTPRSPFPSNVFLAWLVSNGGGYNNGSCYSPFGVRPALLLNPSLLVSYDGTVN